MSPCKIIGGFVIPENGLFDSVFVKYISSTLPNNMKIYIEQNQLVSRNAELPGLHDIGCIVSDSLRCNHTILQI